MLDCVLHCNTQELGPSQCLPASCTVVLKYHSRRLHLCIIPPPVLKLPINQTPDHFQWSGLLAPSGRKKASSDTATIGAVDCHTTAAVDCWSLGCFVHPVIPSDCWLLCLSSHSCWLLVALSIQSFLLTVGCHVYPVIPVDCWLPCLSSQSCRLLVALFARKFGYFSYAGPNVPPSTFLFVCLFIGFNPLSFVGLFLRTFAFYLYLFVRILCRSVLFVCPFVCNLIVRWLLPYIFLIIYVLFSIIYAVMLLCLPFTRKLTVSSFDRLFFAGN